jgi:hypothetical protein
MKLEELQVIISANSDQFHSELLAIQSQLSKLDKATSGVARTTTASFSAMKIAAGIASAAIVIAMTKIIKSSTQLAMQTIESENLVSVTFGNMTGEINKWSDNLQEKLGLNAYQLRKNAGIFFNIANSMGVTRDNALTLSKGIVSLSADMASFYNISNDDAILKLQAGLTGETEPLKRLGIIVDETTTKQTAYREGIAQVGYELTNSQKIMARYVTIMQQTRNAQGDLARTIDSPANQLRIFQSRLQNLSITFGQVFIPIVNAVLPYLNAFVIVIGRAIRAVAAFFGIMGVGKMADVAGSAGSAIEDAGNQGAGGLNNATGAAKALKKELLGLAGFDEMNVLGGNKDGGSGSGSGNLSPDTGFSLKGYDMGLDDMKAQTQGLVDQMAGIFNSLGEKLKPFAEFLKNNWKQILAFIAAITGLIIGLEALGKVVGWASTIGTVATAAYNGVLVVFEAMAAVAAALGISLVGLIAIVAAVVAVGVLLYKNWDTIKAAAVSVWTWMMDNIFKPIGNEFNKIFNGLIIPIMNNFKVAWNLVWTATKIVLKQVWSDFMDYMAPVINWINKNIMPVVNSVTSAFKKAWQSVADFMGGLWNGIKDIFKGGINWIIEKINSFIGKINDAIKGYNDTVGKIPGTQPITYRFSTIPKLASGGMVTSPTLAAMGEGSYKEAVLPLDRNTEWADIIAEKLNGAGGGEPMQLIIKLGEENIFNKFIDFSNNKSLRLNSAALIQ